MNYSLSDFYRGKEWGLLKQQLMFDRISSAGEIICAYCNKPIVNRYDCIGHHKIELTDKNVNDVAISLNPEHIELVHHVCHNKIHHKLGSIKREVYLVYGAPLSGKSTWVADVCERGDIIVDLDNIYECISGQARYDKPDRIKDVVFGVRDYLLDAVRCRLGSWKNAYLIGGYPLQAERERICRRMSAKEIFIDCDQEECIRRLTAINDGRVQGEWEKYIVEWFRLYAPPR